MKSLQGETDSHSDHPNTLDRIRGCLLGVAIGDALGAPFEGVPPGGTNPLLKRIGGNITGFLPDSDHLPAQWTDDTGMTLACCRGFIAYAIKPESGLEAHFRSAFREWANSSECRKTGKTVYRASKYGEPDVNSWASGALMRTSPVAVFAHLRRMTVEETARLALFIARLTHGHPFATYPAMECVLAIKSILDGESCVPPISPLPAGVLPTQGASRTELSESCADYLDYLNARHDALSRLHASSGLFIWRQVFEGHLGLAPGKPWCEMPPFEEGLLRVVNGCYDRDTSGAVAGALLGAYWGEVHIPDRWKLRVEKSREILALADRLFEISRLDEGGRSPWK